MKKSTSNKDKKKPTNKNGKKNQKSNNQEVKKLIINEENVLYNNEKNKSQKLTRKPSVLKLTVDSLMGRNSGLPTALINSPQLMRRSLTFCKDSSTNNKILRPKSTRWYSSLRSLAEDIMYKDNEEIMRTQSLQDQDSTTDWSKNPSSSADHGPKHNNSTLGYNKLPEASSLPALTESAIYENEASYTQVFKREKRGWNGWENFGLSRRMSFMKLGNSGSKEQNQHSVRSRSLSQLDMLDTSEQPLTGNSSHAQQHQLPQNRYHQTSQQHSQNQVDCSPRLLVPNVTTDSTHTPNRNKHKLSRSQVSLTKIIITIV